MTRDVKANDGGRRSLIRGCVLAALAVVALAAVAVHAGDAEARATKPWTRTLQPRLSPGALGLPASASPRRLARAALRQSARRLGLPRSLRGVRLEHDQRVPAGPGDGVALHSLRFQQTLRGRRVLWSQIDVLVGGRKVGLIRATVVPVKPGRVATRPRISSASALATARRAVAGREDALGSQLVTYAGSPSRGRPPRLAYVIETLPASAARTEVPVGLCVVVDARTGRVLTSWRGKAAHSAGHEVTRADGARAPGAGAAQVHFQGRQSVTLMVNDAQRPSSEPPVFGLQIGARYGGWAATESATTRGKPPAYTLANWDTEPFSPRSGSALFQPDLDAVLRNTKDVVVHMCFTRDFCSSAGRSRQGFNWPLFAVTGAIDGVDGNGSFYVLQRVYLTRSDGYANDAIAHELGHHIDFMRSADDHTASREAPEVAEGLADMFAYDFDPEDATLAEDSASGKNTRTPYRNWANPSPQPARMSQYQCTPEPHFNSTILSHAYYEFVQRVGPDVAGFLLYQVPGLRGPNATYVSVAGAFVSVAMTAYPANPEVAAAARQAFLVDGGMDKAPPSCTAPAAPPAPAPAPPPPPPPPPPSQVAVPDVLGDSPGAASSELSNVGLQLGAQRGVVDNTCNNIGNVLSQTPSAGTVVAPGSAVDISIGQMPLPPRSCP